MQRGECNVGRAHLPVLLPSVPSSAWDRISPKLRFASRAKPLPIYQIRDTDSGASPMTRSKYKFFESEYP